MPLLGPSGPSRLASIVIGLSACSDAGERAAEIAQADAESPWAIVTAADEPGRKAINLDGRLPRLETERENIKFFEQLPRNDRSRVDFGTVRGTQFLEPLFEFAGACAGCRDCAGSMGLATAWLMTSSAGSW